MIRRDGRRPIRTGEWGAAVREAGVSQQQIAKLENPDTNPTLGIIEKVAAALGVRFDVTQGGLSRRARAAWLAPSTGLRRTPPPEPAYDRDRAPARALSDGALPMRTGADDPRAREIVGSFIGGVVSSRALA